jgi:hypothetical protein
MDTARLPEQVATRHQLLDRLSRVYIDLYSRAMARAKEPRLVQRVFERGWDRLLHGSRWDEAPVSPDAQAAVADLISRAEYVDDGEGLVSWLDTLPAAAIGYLEPPRYEMHLSGDFPGVQMSMLAITAGGFIAAVAESSGFRVEFASGDGESLERDRDVAERDVVAA